MRISAIHDVNNRKQLKMSCVKVKTVIKTVEVSPDAIIVHNDGIIRFINTAAMKLFKASNENEMIGKPILSLLMKKCKYR